MPLGKVQKLALYGIIRHPDLTDREVASRLDISPTYFSQAKGALAEGGYYSAHYIPMMQKLGYELLCVSFGSLNPSIPDAKRSEIGSALNHENVENFYTVLEPSHAFNISILRNYAAYIRNRTAFERRCEAEGLIEKGSFRHVLFSFEASKILRFFDFAPLLNRLFELGREDVPNGKGTSLEFETVEDRRGELTDTEKRVFYNLVRHPMMPDMALSHIAGTSRVTVSRLRRKLEDEGLLRKLNVPNMKALGVGMMGLFHVKMSPSKPLSSRRAGVEKVLAEPDITFIISGDRESVVISGGVCDFDSFVTRRDEVFSQYRRMGFFDEEPYYMLLSMPKSRFVKNFDFAPVVKKALGLQSEP